MEPGWKLNGHSLRQCNSVPIIVLCVERPPNIEYVHAESIENGWLRLGKLLNTVKQAVEEGQVSCHRYESYARLREEHQKLADMYWWGIQ